MKFFFKKNEIISEENFYLVEKRKKIVVFVPDSHIEKVFSKMSDAGAGKIGDYDKCSFRINGTGSFRPGYKANPFKGNKNDVSFENEIRHEMEFSSKYLSSVVEAMLISHPYEEVAYEIYEFFKLEKKVSGKIYDLKSNYNFKDNFLKKNKELNSKAELNNANIKRVIITEREYDKALEESAKFFDSDLILIYRKNKFNIINLTQ